jgi:hypothetical protein
MSTAIAAAPLREAIRSWPNSTLSAFRSRVAELAPPGSCPDTIHHAEVLAFAEFSPGSGEIEALVSAWPLARRRRFARLVQQLVDAGLSIPASQRQALLALFERDATPSPDWALTGG